MNDPAIKRNIEALFVARKHDSARIEVLEQQLQAAQQAIASLVADLAAQRQQIAILHGRLAGAGATSR